MREGHIRGPPSSWVQEMPCGPLPGSSTHLWFPMTLGSRCSVPTSAAKPMSTSWGGPSCQYLVCAQYCPLPPPPTSVPVKFSICCRGPTPHPPQRLPPRHPISLPSTCFRPCRFLHSRTQPTLQFVCLPNSSRPVTSISRGKPSNPAHLTPSLPLWAPSCLKSSPALSQQQLQLPPQPQPHTLTHSKPHVDCMAYP